MYFVHPEVRETPFYTKFLMEPGCVFLSGPTPIPAPDLLPFLGGINDEYEDYVWDQWSILTGSESLVKFAGQLCYMSFGGKRTKNVDAQKYFNNIISSGHGSVLEHANYSVLLYGVSRSFTHELVRHRAGFAYSQVSQRYVGPNSLRFVMRPEFSKDVNLLAQFMKRIDNTRNQYQDLIADLIERNSTLSTTEKRKAVQQVARAVLTNEVEAPIVVTANIRAWRHFLEMRGNKHAEPEIQRVAYMLLQAFQYLEPELFNDYSITAEGITTSHRKV